MSRKYEKRAPLVSGKQMMLGLLGVIVLVAVVWPFRPGYRTVFKGTASLNPFEENSFYDVFKVNEPGAVFKVDVEAYGERTLSAYLFTKEDYQLYADIQDGKGGNRDNLKPLWAVRDVEKHQEEGITFDYTGDVIFVVSNEHWNQLGIRYQLSAKGLE